MILGSFEPNSSSHLGYDGACHASHAIASPHAMGVLASGSVSTARGQLAAPSSHTDIVSECLHPSDRGSYGEAVRRSVFNTGSNISHTAAEVQRISSIRPNGRVFGGVHEVGEIRGRRTNNSRFDARRRIRSLDKASGKSTNVAHRELDKISCGPDNEFLRPGDSVVLPILVSDDDEVKQLKPVALPGVAFERSDRVSNRQKHAALERGIARYMEHDKPVTSHKKRHTHSTKALLAYTVAAKVGIPQYQAAWGARLTQEQREILEVHYTEQPKPKPHTKRQLAKSFNVPSCKVFVSRYRETSSYHLEAKTSSA